MDDYSWKSRRSGVDRRMEHIDVSRNHRESDDRRDILRHEQVILSKLRDARMFRQVTDDQFRSIMRICVRKECPKDTVVYSEGEPADDMYILLEGVMSVSLRGREVNLISPIGIVGEMGFFTGERRSATVTVKGNAVLLRLDKQELFRLFEDDADLYVRFQAGMISSLSDKLRVTSDIIAKMREKLSSKQ